jgi:hypothetical protein
VPAADAEGWDWSLDGDPAHPEAGFKAVQVGEAGVPFPWDRSPVALQGPLFSPDGTRHEANLVPMGCAPLRRVAFRQR